MEGDEIHKVKQPADQNIPAPEAWPASFPKGIGFTTIRYLRSCEGFNEAKTGNYEAAVSVVLQCLRLNKLVYIWGNYPNVIIVPVISQKPNSNKLPLALANLIGFEVLPTICCESYFCHYQRKQMRAMERLLYPPRVYGDGIICGREYILADDVVTQGGTVNAVRKHIHRGGGNVVAVIALAYSIGSTILKPTQETITLLKYKHGEEELISFIVEYRISDSLSDMTQSQLRYLLRFKSIYTIRRRASNSYLYRNAG